MEPTGTVTFTVKELLERLDAKLDRLDLKLDTKAENHQVEALSRRVDGLEDWRSRIAGGFAVVVLAIGALAARLLGLI